MITVKFLVDLKPQKRSIWFPPRLHMALHFKHIGNWMNWALCSWENIVTYIGRIFRVLGNKLRKKVLNTILVDPIKVHINFEILFSMEQ